MKVTTRLQNHIITSVLVGAGTSFMKLNFYGDDGKESEVEFADYIDAVIE